MIILFNHMEYCQLLGLKVILLQAVNLLPLFLKYYVFFPYWECVRGKGGKGQLDFFLLGRVRMGLENGPI